MPTPTSITCLHCGHHQNIPDFLTPEAVVVCEQCQQEVALAASATMESSSEEDEEEESVPADPVDIKLDQWRCGIGVVSLLFLAHAPFFPWISLGRGLTIFDGGFGFYDKPQGIPGIVFWEGWLLYVTSFLLVIMLAYSWWQCRQQALPSGASAHYWNWAAAAWAGFFLFALMMPHAAFSEIGKSGGGLTVALLSAIAVIAACGSVGGQDRTGYEYWERERTFLLTALGLAVAGLTLPAVGQWPLMHKILKPVFYFGVFCFLLLRIVEPGTVRQRMFSAGLALGVLYWWTVHPLARRPVIRASGPPVPTALYAIPVIAALLLVYISLFLVLGQSVLIESSIADRPKRSRRFAFKWASRIFAPLIWCEAKLRGDETGST